MEKEDKVWIDRLLSGVGALALWIAGELEPESEEVLWSECEVLGKFLQELLVHLAVRRKRTPS